MRNNQVKRRRQARYQIPQHRHTYELLIKPKIENRILVVYGNEGNHDPRFLLKIVLPEVGEDKLQLEVLDRVRGGHLLGFKGRSTIVDPVAHKDIEHIPVQPLKERTVYYGAISPSNRVVVDKGKVGSIKLVFYDPGIVGIPVIINPAVGQAIINICKKPGRLQVPGRVLTPPDPYKAVCLISRIAQDLKAVGDRSIFAIGRYDGDLSRGAIFQTVKRTLDMVSDYLALAELYAPVDTFVPKTVHFPAVVPPEDEFFSHPDHSHRFVSDLGGVHNYIPLLRNHIAPVVLNKT